MLSKKNMIFTKCTLAVGAYATVSSVSGSKLSQSKPRGWSLASDLRWHDEKNYRYRDTYTLNMASRDFNFSFGKATGCPKSMKDQIKLQSGNGLVGNERLRFNQYRGEYEFSSQIKVKHEESTNTQLLGLKLHGGPQTGGGLGLPSNTQNDWLGVEFVDDIAHYIEIIPTKQNDDSEHQTLYLDRNSLGLSSFSAEIKSSVVKGAFQQKPHWHPDYTEERLVKLEKEKKEKERQQSLGFYFQSIPSIPSIGDIDIGIPRAGRQIQTKQSDGTSSNIPVDIFIIRGPGLENLDPTKIEQLNKKLRQKNLPWALKFRHNVYRNYDEYENQIYLTPLYRGQSSGDFPTLKVEMRN